MLVTKKDLASFPHQSLLQSVFKYTKPAAKQGRANVYDIEDLIATLLRFLQWDSTVKAASRIKYEEILLVLRQELAVDYRVNQSAEETFSSAVEAIETTIESESTIESTNENEIAHDKISENSTHVPSDDISGVSLLPLPTSDTSDNRFDDVASPLLVETVPHKSVKDCVKVMAEEVVRTTTRMTLAVSIFFVSVQTLSAFLS